MSETTVNNEAPRKGNPMIPLIIIVLLLLVGGALLLMNNQSSSPTTTTTTQQPTQVAPSPTEAMNITGTATPSATTSTTPTTTGSASEVLTVNMEAGSFYYNPKVINAKKGQHVKIVLKAVDMMHNFNIDELNVHSTTVRSGNSATIEFTADKAGTFEYYCAVANHRQQGQVGTLIVQ